jgi:hypothetical protein
MGTPRCSAGEALFGMSPMCQFWGASPLKPQFLALEFVIYILCALKKIINCPELFIISSKVI